MYCTIEDLIAEGVEVNDENRGRLTALISAAGEKIDAWLGQFFEPRVMTFDFCGHGGRTLVFGVPILELQEITICGRTAPLEEVRVVNGSRFLIREEGWPKGYYNIAVKGLFGCVTTEMDDEGRISYRTPAPVREAAMRLVVRDMAQIGDAAAQDERRRSRVVKETTDGHSYELDNASAGSGTSGTWSGDYEIDALLWPFKAPVRLAVL